MDRTSGRPAEHATKGDAMVPGLSEADCRAAEFRLREMRAEAARRRPAATSHPIGRGGTSGGALRMRAGALLVRTGQRLQGVSMADAAPCARPAASGLAR